MLDTERPTRIEADTDERELAELVAAEVAEITARLGHDRWVWVEGPDGALVVVEVDIPEDRPVTLEEGEEPLFGLDEPF